MSAGVSMNAGTNSLGAARDCLFLGGFQGRILFENQDVYFDKFQGKILLDQTLRVSFAWNDLSMRGILAKNHLPRRGKP